MKILKKKHLQTLEVETTENGVVIWYVEEIRGKNVRHWLLDGSRITEDGTIELGRADQYKINAVYDETDNTIKIIDKTKN